MEQRQKQSEESCGTTIGLSNGIREIEAVTVATTDNVHFVERKISYVSDQENTISLDSLISELSSDPEFSADLKNAHAWVGDTFYKDERSIRALRLSRGMSQSDLAKAMETSQPQIAKIENGKSDPQFSTLVRLAKVFEMPVSDLAGILAEER